MGPRKEARDQQQVSSSAPAPPVGRCADPNSSLTPKRAVERDQTRIRIDRLPVQVQLSDFVGEHGAYQLALTSLLFVRYVLLGLMANSGPLLTPDVTFYCQLPEAEVLSIMPNISLLSARERELEIKEEFKQICQIDLHLYHNQTSLLLANSSSSRVLRTASVSAPVAKLSSARIRECTDFSYELAPDQGRTMTSEFDLVCDRDSLRSLFQALLSAAIVVAHVFWGTFSDRYGRFQAQRLCLLVSLLAGAMSLLTPDFWTFTLARALCSLGDLGLVVSLTTTVVELVGSRFRGLSVALVNFGYALGVTLLPYIVAYFEDFRLVVSFTVLCHLVTIPFVLATGESVRWQLTNRKFKLARGELKRIVRLNRSWSSLCQSVSSRVCLRFRILKGPVKSQAATTTMSQQQALSDQKGSPPRGTKGEHFDLMFKQFIEQLESQNLCDPLGKPPDASEADPEPTSYFGPEASGDVAETVRERLGSAEPTDREAELATGWSAQVEPGKQLGRAELLSEISVVVVEEPRIVPCGGCHLSSSPPVITVTRAPISRPASCSQLDRLDLGPDRHLLNSLARFGDPGPCQTRLKALTLPTRGGQLDEGRGGLLAEEDFRQRGAQLRKQPDCINLVASQLSFMGRVSRLFKDKRLMVAVFTIVWTTFNSELQYTSFIIVNLEVGEDVYLNYVLGGCMEALAAVSASLLLSYSPRRWSLITFWLLISASCFGLSIAHIDSTWAVWLLALAKFSQSCLSSIASVAAYEAFPTFLRQSGSGLVFTLGMLGSVFAPLIFAEFDDQAGMDRVLMTFSVSSLTAASLIYLFLSETRGCELQ